MGLRRSQWGVRLWGVVVEEFEWPLHMCVAQREEHADAPAQVSERTPTSKLLKVAVLNPIHPFRVAVRY